MKEEPGILVWTAEQIRTAAYRAGYLVVADKILTALGEPPKEHAFADGDTVTVAELKDAWARCSSMNVNDLLRDISEHRYQNGGVYRDARGEYYKRRGEGWLKFGDSCFRGHDVPVRPLEKMP